MEITTSRSGLKVAFGINDIPTAHPATLDALSDEEIELLIQTIQEKKIDHAASAADPAILPGFGQILFVGYDCEWVGNPKSESEKLKCLSYQFYLVGVGGEMSAVFFPATGHVRDRLSLQQMLSDLLHEAVRCGVILDHPENLVLVGFFLRADLAMLSDLIEFKTELGNIGGKIATTRQPVSMDLVCMRRDFDHLDSDRRIVCNTNGPARQVQISFYDIAKHAPEKTPLSTLGALLKLDKLPIPDGFSIARMDELLVYNPSAFMAYGVRDAEIAVKYYGHALEYAKEHIGGRRIDEGFLPLSAGALAVKMCLKKMNENGLIYEETFGVASETRQVWDESKGRPQTIQRTVKDGMRAFHEAFATLCYHGGRNESYYFGPAKAGRWFDFDLIGAYSVGMVIIRPINYAASFETRDPAQFQGDIMGFAWVDFEFPPCIRYPCLPVRTELHGLLFPSRGTSYCTAPEISLALRVGAKIKIRRGVIYPWMETDQRIFEPHVRETRRQRKFYAKGSLPEQYSKLVANSVYGKTGQGLKEKTVFDTGRMSSMKVPESELSNAPMAAFVTGFIRAVMGEIMLGIPSHRTVLSCTTDGILTDASEDELDLSGELAQCFMGLIERVSI